MVRSWRPCGYVKCQYRPIRYRRIGVPSPSPFGLILQVSVALYTFQGQPLKIRTYIISVVWQTRTGSKLCQCHFCFQHISSMRVCSRTDEWHRTKKRKPERIAKRRKKGKREWEKEKKNSYFGSYLQTVLFCRNVESTSASVNKSSCCRASWHKG